jgi:hypothetical protein
MDQKPVVQYDEGAPGGNVVQSTMVESRMQAALMKENPSPFRKSFFRMYAVIFVGYLCSATNGFDANTFGRFEPVLSHSTSFLIQVHSLTGLFSTKGAYLPSRLS